MDSFGPAIVASLIAVASLAFAVFATLSARTAVQKATAAAANPTALDAAHETARLAQQEAAAAVARLADVEKRLINADTELHTAFDRAARLEQRLAETETKLREATEVVIAAPIPIPTRRSSARLEELRATLRAQAAEASEEAEPA